MVLPPWETNTLEDRARWKIEPETRGLIYQRTLRAACLCLAGASRSPATWHRSPAWTAPASGRSGPGASGPEASPRPTAAAPSVDAPDTPPPAHASRSSIRWSRRIPANNATPASVINTNAITTVWPL